MPRLYRSPLDFHHWLLWSDASGWSRFPAKINGWDERRSVASIDRQQLCPVPLRLAFNTGLLEALEGEALELAA